MIAVCQKNKKTNVEKRKEMEKMLKGLRSWLIGFLTIGLLLGSTILGLAEEQDKAGASREEGYRLSQKPSCLIDKNNDGTIDEAEEKAWRQLRRERLDRNQDGVIDENERQMVRPFFKKTLIGSSKDGAVDAGGRQMFRIGRNDLNKVGKVNAIEKKNYRRRRDIVEDVYDRREDVRDRREDIVDRREDIADRRDDVVKANKLRNMQRERQRLIESGASKEEIQAITKQIKGLKRNIIADRREDVFGRREDIRDRRENIRDRREDIRDRGPLPDRKFGRPHLNQQHRRAQQPSRPGGPGRFPRR